MKEVKLMFYKTNPSEKNKGMKVVLWRVTDDKGKSVDDWGFADWLGSEWDFTGIDMPEGFSTEIVAWANTPNPEILTVERRIIS